VRTAHHREYLEAELTGGGLLALDALRQAAPIRHEPARRAPVR